ncbi:MAG: hypothetical protein KDB27_09725 [Planctomycetales bacterium]|nr:hypothetical protein [Planctomycetales bacterium]
MSENNKVPGPCQFESLVELPQDEFDSVFFQRVLERSSNNIDVLRRQAELLSRTDRYAEALELDQRLARILPNDQVVHYNLACSLCLNGQVGSAIVALQTAIELGYSDFARIESDPDLDLLRDEPEYVALIDKYADLGF